jgi:hypothetical protein
LKRKNNLFLEKSLDKNIEICRGFIEFGSEVLPKTTLEFIKCVAEVDSEK